MAKKQSIRKAATAKPAAFVRTNSSETKSPEGKPTSKWHKFRSKLPPVFCESTTREDKLCFFSFCCGIVLMACLFFADLFIRNYLESRRWEERILHTLQMKLDHYGNMEEPPRIDGVIILNKQDTRNKDLSNKSFQKKNKNTPHDAF